MTDLSFDLRNLRYAKCVADVGSIRRAADELNLAQSTISRRLQQLEHRIGASLFVRTANGTTLTPAGSRFLERAELGAQQMHRAIDDIRLVERDSAGVLSVGIPHAFPAEFFRRIFRPFRQCLPNVHVHVKEAAAEAHLYAVASGHLDIAFVFGEVTRKGYRCKRILNEFPLLALPNEHRLANCEGMKWEQLVSETLMLTDDPAGKEIESYVIRNSSKWGGKLRIVRHSISQENLLALIASGMGMTVVPQSAAMLDRPGVAFLPFREEIEPLIYNAVWRAERRLQPVLCRFLRLLESHSA